MFNYSTLIEQRRQGTTKKGFTLIEILLVIALLAILAAIVIVAINPGRQLQNARDTQRKTDTLVIMNAVYQYAVDNNGTFPGGLSTNDYEICRTGAECGSEMYDFSDLTNNSRYLVSMPLDPLCDTDNGDCDPDGIGYYISKTANGRVQISGNGESVDILLVR